MANFRKFTKKYITTSDRVYKDTDDLRLSNAEYNIFFTGSDQVWSYYCAGFDKAFFLDFVDDNKKKNSYAASFGVDNIPDEYIEQYINLLSNFNNISLREYQGKNIVKELINKDAEVVLDPTLLLNKDEWKSIASPNVFNEKYILVYLLAETKSIIKFAKQLAQKKNLKIIYVHDRIFNQRGMNNIKKVSPEEWLNLFINAEYIVTNSFHGIAFSVNFGKNFFMEYLPEPAKVNSRLENILKMFNLENRCINSSQFSLDDKINYDNVEKILNMERNKSLTYLKKILLK